MKISSINIKKFKSIDNITIKLNEHGQGNNKSGTVILVGINESGKSNILEAIDATNHLFKGYDFESTYYKLGDRESDNYVDVYYNLDIQDSWNEYLTVLEDSEQFPAELLNAIELISVKRNIYLSNNGSGNAFIFTIQNNILWHHYKIDYTSIVKDGKDLKEFKEIIKITDDDAVINNITPIKAKNFLEDGQKLLTKLELELLIKSKLLLKLRDDFPTVIYWKSSPEHLINDKISLIKFKNNTAISRPLKNIFNIHGLDNDGVILKAIERALSNDEYKTELEEGLTTSVTEHVNKIWKEHKVKFKIKFDGDICKVHVEDLATKHKFYKMQHRSDGFKQFISLILSLSAENNSNLLKNNIILLDEPEVHLHPSGIRYLRDEILKIGINNQVIVATHSHYFVDTNTPQRHWIVEKDTATKIKQLDETSNFGDDEVISKAFGINLLRELIPENILIVEGYGDKSIINHVFKILSKQIIYNIKNAAGVSKVNSFAALVASENINTIILLDDDKEGKQAKQEIIKNLKNHFNKNNVFTLKDIFPELPDGATLEDLYPIEFSNNFFTQSLGKEVILSDDKSLILQLKTIDNSFGIPANKAKLDKFKMDMCEEFRQKYVTKKQIESANRLKIFCDKLIEIMM